MIKAIIFDCFGVVVGEGFWKTFVRAGGDLVKDKDFVDDLISSESLKQQSADTFHKRVSEYLNMDINVWKQMNDEGERPNQELIDHIGNQLRKEFKTALLSNASVGAVEKRLSEQQLAVFDLKIISAEVGMMKPDPAIFKLTADKLGVQPEECVFVDDHAPYLAGAQEAGMNTILFRDLQTFQQELGNITVMPV